MAEPIIQTENLTVYYGKHRGISDVNITVEQGEVFGFLGPNGAGKTTTQRVLMDIIRPTSGRAFLFGLDAQRQGVQARRRMGYLPGELSLYGNMRASDFLQMYHSLQGGKTNSRYWQTLAERLNLDTSRKIREFSRGNKQKVGVVMAFMNKPELLILDEPTGGLDPLVQQTVMELVREAQADGATIFFSSHILPEVQAVCDRVGIIRDGRLVATERVEDLTRQQFKRLRLNFATMPPAGTFNFPGVTITTQDTQSMTLEIRQNLDRVLAAAVPFGITDIETQPVTLEEVFLAYYGKSKEENHA